MRTVICSDKTGTLTQNEMTVVQAWAGGKHFRITGEGYNPAGAFYRDGQAVDPASDTNFSLLLHTAMLCNDARLVQRKEDKGEKSWQIIGDPTEGALIVAAAKAGLHRDEAEKVLRRVMEIPFDSERVKRRTTIHLMHTAGAEFCFDCPAMIAFVKESGIPKPLWLKSPGWRKFSATSSPIPVMNPWLFKR